jgi:photosystem II stability/assembly factor-like uncharacterized protein
MTTLTPRGPEHDQLPHVDPAELDALIREARRRARRRRVGYAAGAVLAGLIGSAVFFSLGGGEGNRPAASGNAGNQAARTRLGTQPRFDPQSVSFISPSVGWAWGPGIAWLAHGHGPGVLARTEDGGRNWTVVPTPGIDYQSPSSYPADGASGVRFIDRQHGYLFGGVLYVTADRGRHWTRIHPPNRILDLEVGAGRAYAVIAGCRGLAACTEDDLYRLAGGGPTFIRRFVRTGPTSAVDPSAGQLVVHGRSVFLLAPPPAYRISRALPLWVSADGGRSWRQSQAPCRGQAQPALLAAWSGDGLVMACGGEPGAGFQAKTLYISTDAGAHWRLAGRIPGAPRLHGMSSGYIASLAAADHSTWILGEARGGILITHDAGRTWQAAAFTGSLGPVEGWGYFDFTDTEHGVAVPWTLNGSVLAFTRNAGRGWHTIPFPTTRSR